MIESVLCVGRAVYDMCVRRNMDGRCNSSWAVYFANHSALGLC